MVTNPKTYLACSLKGLYRKADSFRKGIIVCILPMTVTPSSTSLHHILHHHQSKHFHEKASSSPSSLKTFRNVTIIIFTLLAIVSSGSMVFNQVGGLPIYQFEKQGGCSRNVTTTHNRRFCSRFKDVSSFSKLKNHM